MLFINKSNLKISMLSRWSPRNLIQCLMISRELNSHLAYVCSLIKSSFLFGESSKTLISLINVRWYLFFAAISCVICEPSFATERKLSWQGMIFYQRPSLINDSSTWSISWYNHAAANNKLATDSLGSLISLGSLDNHVFVVVLLNECMVQLVSWKDIESITYFKNCCKSTTINICYIVAWSCRSSFRRIAFLASPLSVCPRLQIKTLIQGL